MVIGNLIRYADTCTALRLVQCRCYADFTELHGFFL